MRQRGFTLIEMIVALSLLAFGLALTFGALRGATKATQNAEITAQRSERLRAVQGFLRRQLGGALPMVYATDETSGEGTLFYGEANKLQFVASMPGYLSRGGPYLQTLELVPGENAQQLQFQYQLLTPDGPLPAEREPEVLIDGIDEGGFEFPEFDDEGKLASWEPEWKVNTQLPALLRLNLRFNDARMRWPVFEVALRLGMSSMGNMQEPSAPFDTGRPR